MRGRPGRRAAEGNGKASRLRHGVRYPPRLWYVDVNRRYPAAQREFTGSFSLNRAGLDAEWQGNAARET